MRRYPFLGALLAGATLAGASAAVAPPPAARVAPTAPTTFTLAAVTVALRPDTQTLARLSPRAKAAVSFVPIKREAERAGDGYNHIGDLNVRLHTPGGAWQNFASAHRRAPIRPLAATRGTLAAADITVTMGAGFSLTVVRRWTDERGALGMHFALTNRGTVPVEIGALGMPMVFDNIITDRSLDEAHAEASFVDPYIGREAGYLQVTRLNGRGPALLVLPARGTPLEAYVPLKNPREAGDGAIFTDRSPRGHLKELYGIDVSPDLISTVTDAVLETVAEWQGRPLDTCYPLVFFDAIRVKIRDEGFVRNKAVYIALGILPDGTKDILGIWIEQTEGAKFWLRVMNELRNRGVADILIAVVDGLKGFPEAINAAFPETVVQTCIVHLLRNSMSFASWKDRKPIAQALRSVYRAETAEAGLAALDAFEAGPWGKRHPAIAQSWRRHWDQVIPFFAFPEGVRRIIYTTNAIEALNSKLRRAVRTRGHFPGDDAAMKLLYLVLNTAAQEWKRPPREWSEAKTQFAVIFGERFVI